MLQPGEKILVVSGIPGKKSHGEPPAREGMRTYHLFQREPLLQGDGTIIRLAMNQLEVARVRLRPRRPDRRGQAGATRRNNGGARCPSTRSTSRTRSRPTRRRSASPTRPASCRADYGAACTWKSDNELSVSRKGLDARVALEPSRVHIDLNLGFLMTPFAEQIKTGITKKLTAILAAPG